MQSQFDHLVETYFNGFDFDLGERELGYALSCDYDLEMFSARTERAFSKEAGEVSSFCITQ